MSRQDVLKFTAPPIAERRRIIEAEPLPANMGALLDQAVADAPDSLAWDFFESGERASYSELRKRVNRLANGMLALGIRHGTHVGVMLPNLAAMPTTWLALARIGAVMVPMNIGYTGREMNYVIDTGAVDWMVIDQACLPALDALPQRPERLSADRIVVLGTPRPGERRWTDLFEGARDDIAGAPVPGLDDLMNIQFTSGTTGFPKGCMLTQRYWLTIGKVNARRDFRRYERILAAVPFFYMDPQWMLLMTFYQRGTLYAARRQSASRFIGWLRDYRINFTLFPEVVFKQPPAPTDRDNAITRVNVYGLSKDAHMALEERFDFCAREAFGMTEIGSGMFVPIEATDKIGSGSCGMAAPFRELRIADDAGRTLGTGETGELLVRGPGILQGYYNNAKATAEAFHGDWFRTGDLFRQDERGYFYIVGRLKDMIRRAGENIAAREVEAVLRLLPEIAEAAALPVTDAQRGQEIKAILVLQPGLTPADLPLERVVAHCEANLARFKVPRYFSFTDKLPKTPSEKIAKHVLTAGVADLRAGAFDRVDGVWR
ncbi:MAG: AMP-binding protein [Alphaproteobacteria bacterium]|nr:AMP-binding protein [Alphaproteobacteria bacterium]